MVSEMMAPQPIRVFIADDHAVLRGSLRWLIDTQPDMRVVGEAGSGPDAEVGIRATEPHVVLMDLSMPGGGGLAAIAAVKQFRPKTTFLVLTAQHEAAYVRAAVNAGAAGFVVKSAAHTELLAAIRAVAQGRTFIDTSSSMEGAHRASIPLSTPAAGPTPQLTTREREVLVRVAEGYTNGQIAAELGLGVKSVETYRARLMEKLGLDGRPALVRFALESGLLAAGRAKR